MRALMNHNLHPLHIDGNHGGKWTRGAVQYALTNTLSRCAFDLPAILYILTESSGKQDRPI
jgi:hypothetical protein